MTIQLAVAVASVGVLAMAGCSKQSTGTARPVPSQTSVSLTVQPTANIDIASAVRQWWQRVAPISGSRYFNARLCGLKQPGKVWLLGGGAPAGKAQRSCTVTANLPILAPVYNEFEPSADGPHQTPTLSPNQMNVTLDGKPLTPVRVTNSRPYEITSAVPGNPLDLRNGMRVVDDGYWVLINPGLAPGRHQLDIRTLDMSNRLWTLVAS